MSHAYFKAKYRLLGGAYLEKDDSACSIARARLGIRHDEVADWYRVVVANSESPVVHQAKPASAGHPPVITDFIRPRVAGTAMAN